MWIRWGFGMGDKSRWCGEAEVGSGRVNKALFCDRIRCSYERYKGCENHDSCGMKDNKE